VSGTAIVPYGPEHHGAFGTLNREWLVDYGLLEPVDEQELADPVAAYLTPGGAIFIAVEAGVPIGTCAIVPWDATTHEIAKLSVTAAAQGRGIGGRLVDTCLECARARGARRVVLVSSSRLGRALDLYASRGFTHEPMPPHIQGKYATADVFMALPLG
jgi:GNAT superfamily N-acetyltransferase